METVDLSDRIIRMSSNTSNDIGLKSVEIVRFLLEDVAGLTVYALDATKSAALGVAADLVAVTPECKPLYYEVKGTKASGSKARSGLVVNSKQSMLDLSSGKVILVRVSRIDCPQARVTFFRKEDYSVTQEERYRVTLDTPTDF